MSPEQRKIALFNFYRMERAAKVDALTANENMGDYAKRLDALQYERDLDVIRKVLESK